ncbi:MAG: hypothetical protein ACKPEO_09905 [Sphaerospermopsis kisseleviana]
MGYIIPSHQSPVPSPQSPVPSPQSSSEISLKNRTSSEFCSLD